MNPAAPRAFLAALIFATIPSWSSAGPSGTHLLAEANLGLAVPQVAYLGPGVTGGGIIGIGGKFQNFPPRFYFIAGAEVSAFSGEGTHADAGVSFMSDRSYLDLLGGLRVLLPIYDEIRVYVDILGGGQFVDGTVERSDGSAISKQDWAGEWSLAAGIEYRWHQNASTGIRIAGVFGGADVDVLDAYAGETGSGYARLNVVVSQAWLF